jgi:hypothetical protein
MDPVKAWVPRLEDGEGMVDGGILVASTELHAHL